MGSSADDSRPNRQIRHLSQSEIIALRRQNACPPNFGLRPEVRSDMLLCVGCLRLLAQIGRDGLTSQRLVGLEHRARRIVVDGTTPAMTGRDDRLVQYVRNSCIIRGTFWIKRYTETSKHCAISCQTRMGANNDTASHLSLCGIRIAQFFARSCNAGATLVQ
jgi:hypothetical protein